MLGLIARSDFPCVETSERTPARQSNDFVSQKEQTHSCCTAALDGNCEVHAHVAQPCAASLATSARLHLALAGVAGSHRNSGG